MLFHIPMVSFKKVQADGLAQNRSEWLGSSDKDFLLYICLYHR